MPILLIINKIDLLKGNADLIQIIDRWKEILRHSEPYDRFPHSQD